MENRIEVSIPELRGAATKIRDAATEYLRLADQLNAAANELAATWEGESQVAFETEQNRAYEWYKKMGTLSQEYAQSMDAAANRYEQADDEAASFIKQT